MRKSILIVEENWQVAAAQALLRRADVEVVAVFPDACYALERAGVTFHPVEDYYSSSDIVELAFEVSHSTLDRLCRCGDEVVEAVSPICRQEGLRPFAGHHYVLMCVLDSVVHTAFVLSRITGAEAPGELLYFPTDAEPLKPNLEFRAESIYSRVIPLLAERRGIRLTPVVGQRRRGAGAADRSPCAGERRWRALLPEPLKQVTRRLRRGWHRRPWSAKEGAERTLGGPRLLLLDLGFDVNPVLERLWQMGAPSPVVWQGAGIDVESPYVLADGKGSMASVHVDPVLLTRCAEEGRRCAAALRADAPFRRLLEINGIDLFPVLERRLVWLLERNLPRQLETWLRAGTLLEQRRIEAVLATEVTSFARVEVVRAARAAGIPVIVYQHGGAYGYSHPYAHEISALKWADYFLAYGEGVASFFNARRAASDGVIRALSIAVGSARLDGMVQAARGGPRRVDRGKPTVVYACHTLTERNWRIPYCIYDNNRYWEWQKQIIEVFRRYPEVEVTIRPYPNQRDHPIVEYLRDLALPNCRIETERPFSSLIEEGDLFLLDYDGTVMLEAITTMAPVIVFAEQESTWIEPRALELLDRRVVYARSLKEYLDQIEEALARLVWTERVTADEFLKAYGTHLNDGRSDGRVVQALVQIIEGRASDSL